MRKKIQNVILFVTVFAVTLSVITPSIAWADAKSKNIDDHVNAQLSAKFLQNCITRSGLANGASRDFISPENIDSGQWFHGNIGIGGGTQGVPKGNGELEDCSNAADVQSAATTLGWTDMQTALLDLGFKTEKGNYVRNGDGGSMSGPAYQAMEKKWGGPLGQIDGNADAVRYRLLMQVFVDGCGATETTDARIAEGDLGVKIKVASDKNDGTVQEKMFQLSKSKGEDRYPISNGDGSNEKKSCGDIANEIGEKAQAYANWAKGKNSGEAPGTGGGSGGENGDKGKKTCTVEGIGWIVCPVSKTLGIIVDRMYKMMQALLRVPPIDAAPSADNALHKAWDAMRNIANVIFVILFMIVVYSQLTSVGISNYGIKKILPKMVVGAILINLSFWICILAVDMSNMIGTSLYDILYTLYKGLLDTASWETTLVWLMSAGAVGAAGVFAFVAVGSPLVTAALWLMIPLAIIAVLALLTGLVVLAFRQGLIILLVFVSPIAFAAYLLPNTQVWFDKWRKLFTTMLVFYPLMSLMFGGGQIAAAVLIASSKKAGTGTGIVLVGAGLLVQVLPLFMAPMLMKNSMGFLGKVAGKVQSIGNKAAAPASKFARAQARERSALGKARFVNNKLQNGGLQGRIARRMRSFDHGARGRKLEMSGLEARQEAAWNEQVAQNRELAAMDSSKRVQEARGSNATAQRTSDYYKEMEDSQEMRQEAGGIRPKGEQHAYAAAYAANVKEFNDNVASEKSTMSKASGAELSSNTMNTGLSVERRAASAGQLTKNGSDEEIQAMVTQLGSARAAQQAKLADAQTRKDDAAAAEAERELDNLSNIQQQFASDLGARKPQLMSATGMSAMEKGQFSGNYQKEALSRIENGKISGENIKNMGAADRKALTQFAQAEATRLDTDHQAKVAQHGAGSVQAQTAKAAADKFRGSMTSLKSSIREFERSEQGKGARSPELDKTFTDIKNIR